jgi:hypothetical protein
MIFFRIKFFEPAPCLMSSISVTACNGSVILSWVFEYFWFSYMDLMRTTLGVITALPASLWDPPYTLLPPWLLSDWSWCYWYKLFLFPKQNMELRLDEVLVIFALSMLVFIRVCVWFIMWWLALSLLVFLVSSKVEEEDRPILLIDF